MEKDYKLCRNLACGKFKNKNEFHEGRSVCKNCIKERNRLSKNIIKEDKHLISNIDYIKLNDRVNDITIKIDNIDNKLNEIFILMNEKKRIKREGILIKC